MYIEREYIYIEIDSVCVYIYISWKIWGQVGKQLHSASKRRCLNSPASGRACAVPP